MLLLFLTVYITVNTVPTIVLSLFVFCSLYFALSALAKRITEMVQLVIIPFPKRCQSDVCDPEVT